MTYNLDNEILKADQNKIGWPWTLTGPPSMFDTAINWPKISIVTPSFNQGQYIEETIRSVLLQNYPNLEYIIIDGGSTDETVSLIKKYEKWVTFWTSEPDTGQSNAINKGIARCTGEIFNWLNSDDYYLPDTLYQVATAFINDPSLQVVSGFENHIELNGLITLKQGTTLMKTLPESIEFCEIAQPSTFIKLDVIRKIGGVSEDLHYTMDGEMWVKFLLLFGQQSFQKLNTVLVNFRYHENSKTIGSIVVDYFLFERTSILSSIQRVVGVPEEIINYYVNEIYKSPVLYKLERHWQFDNRVISQKELRIYFIQKYVTKQFIIKMPKRAFWGMKQLAKHYTFDLFFLKSALKLVFNKF